MTDWVKACNPTAPIANETEATAAARASAIAIFIGMLWALYGIVYLMSPAGEAMMAAAEAQTAAQSPGMEGLVSGAAWGGAIAAVVIPLILGLVQWFKPNVVIPIIFTILVVWGLGSTILGLITAGGNLAATTPMWQVVVGVILMIIELILHIAGIRGGNALGKFRREGAIDTGAF